MSTNDTKQDSGSELRTETIGPHDEAGYSPTDVLADAEEGDSIRLEMDFHDRTFETVRGDVPNIVEQEEDDGLVQKTIQIEGTGENEMVNVAVKTDPSSAYVSLCTAVRFVKRSEDDYVFGELDDLTMCELTREVEA